MSNRNLAWYIAAIIAAGVLCIILLALSKGPTELMALAAVFTAAATLVANIKAKGK